MKEKIMLIFVGIILSVLTQTIAVNIIPSNSVSYSNNKTTETTVNGALDELFNSVSINERLGSTDISTIGDGTITGAINKLNNNFDWKLLDFKSGRSVIPLNIPFEELSIKITATTNSYFKIHLLRDELPNDGTFQYFTTGGTINDENQYGITIAANQSYVQLVNVYLNKVDVTESAAFDVRYR